MRFIPATLRAIELALIFLMGTAACASEGTSIKIGEGERIKSADIATGWHLRRQYHYKAPPYGVQLVTAPQPVKSGKYSLRIELRRGDCDVVTGGWSDCQHTNERNEIITTGDDFMPVNTKGDYGWSFYLPSDWNPTDLCEIIMGQFHEENRFNPDYQFFYQSHGGGLQVKSRVDTNNGTFGKDVRTIIPEKDLRGRWHDIRVQVYWRNKNDGYFRVWADGQLAYDFKGRTTAAKRVFYKLGFYRLSATAESPTLVMYYDDIWRK